MDEPSMRRVSRSLLGNKHKLEVVVAIATVLDEGLQDFYPRLISQRVPAAADNQVNDVIKQLEAGGLLIPVEDKADQLRNRYRARESSYWRLCQVLLEELREASWELDES
jgi:hypothetical protein